MFSNYYINVIEKTSGIAPESLGDSSMAESKETEKQNFKRLWKSPKCFKN